MSRRLPASVLIRTWSMLVVFATLVRFNAPPHSCGAQESDGVGPLLITTDRHVWGDALQLIMESRYATKSTRTSEGTLTGHSWLLSLKAKDGKWSLDRSTCYGPLYDGTSTYDLRKVIDPLISYDAAGDLGGPTSATFAPSGTVWLFRGERGEPGYSRYELALEPQFAQWARKVEFDPASTLIAKRDETWVTTKSGRFLVSGEGGTPRVFDVEDGKFRMDQWLVGAVRDFERISELRNVRWFIDEKLQYFVCLPHKAWNRGDGELVESFRYKGKEYSRTEYGMFWRRGEEGGTVMKVPERAREALFREVLFCRDDVYMLAKDKKKLILSRLTGDGEWEIDYPNELGPGVILSECKVDDTRECVYVFATRSAGKSPWSHDQLVVCEWNWKEKKSSVHSLDVMSLFRQEGNELRPKEYVKVR